MKYALGHIKDTPDDRDFHRRFVGVAPVPDIVDLSTEVFAPPIYDQGTIGSCVWNATGRVLRAHAASQGLPAFDISRLFGYWYTRKAEGTVDQDAGCQPRDAIKVAASIGLPPETLWPYDVDKFTEQPPQAAYDAAGKFEALKYERLSDPDSGQIVLEQILQTLAGRERFTFAVQVYASFMDDDTARTGIIPIPNPDQENYCGGHDLCAEGYNKITQQIKFANSWNTTWGQKGYGFLPFSYFTNPSLTSDLWAITLVS